MTRLGVCALDSQGGQAGGGAGDFPLGQENPTMDQLSPRPKCIVILTWIQIIEIIKMIQIIIVIKKSK